MEHVVAIIASLPPETWTVLGGVLAAALGGRYAWVARAARVLADAATAAHPDDHGAQLAHVERKPGRRAAAKRAAAIIRRRMAEAPHPLEADIGHSDNVPTPVLNAAEAAAADIDPETDTVPTRRDSSRAKVRVPGPPKPISSFPRGGKP